ncbi:U3 snoRNP protein [Scheffersomyces stipitis CBS 6054]|uniref:U3 snoRNP protein n=1 Tax=Scheffersomyces stipitis (strain ATCC 58785 / CBS 6054 / NBRC 10063 / NRRL Y-11545) TaxID=322104 RepID=A3LZY4_PICST|nr:U3 snoRNP protein [Scheffersomyces stipitis CBS 6054]ABN68425.2 U3 snoRNP protein [Scheffersomyces stipitis CBS 6054]
MAKTAKTKSTESSRRHAFSSFRERIDSIKIEPNLKLTKRVHDYVETSHFLATLDHWKEVNLSGNFSEFVDKVEIYSQTLPQILHHQSFIFDALCTHIKVNDINSIQPLLELVAQFIHDLGDDFLVYYSKFLQLLTEIALETIPNDSQNQRNTSNVLEWTFNCLAFAFKYLSRSLTSDLQPTFEIFLPILQMKKKTYISRFCAESLAFLVRKSKADALTSIMMFCFSKIDSMEESDSYPETLAILFAESIKHTKGTFHSKTNLILSKILEVSFHKLNIQKKSISILSDIILDLINHGTSDTCKQVYKVTMEFLLGELKNENSIPSVSQLLTVLIFAESGKKITDWISFTEILNALLVYLSNCQGSTENDSQLAELTSYLFVIVLRNGDLQVLTKLHRQIFITMSSFCDGKYFLAFAESCVDLTRERAKNFGLLHFIQKYVNQLPEESNEIKKVAYLLTKLSKNHSELLHQIELPLHIHNYIRKDIKTQADLIRNSKVPLDFYWLLQLSKFVKEDADWNNDLIDLLLLLTEKFDVLPRKLCCDLIAAIIISLYSSSIPRHEKLVKGMKTVLSMISKIKESSDLIRALQTYILRERDQAKLFIEAEENFLMEIAQNLSLPSSQLRCISAEFLLTVLDTLGHENTSYVSQIRIIEQIPLSITTGRDITLRIRNLASDFKNDQSPSEFDCVVVTNFLFGMLSNRFQPCWDAVYETLPSYVPICSSILWDMASKFILTSYSSTEDTYMDLGYSPLEDNEIVDWHARNPRLRDNFVNYHEKYFLSYQNITESLYEFAKESWADNSYNEFMRSHTLKALSSIPSIAEAHSQSLVDLVLSLEDIDNEDDPLAKKERWQWKDRNDLLALFGKFKNLKKVHKADILYDYFLRLLCSNQLQVQKMALEVLLHWGKGPIRKYRDNLQNLLDDNIFRDELSNLAVGSQSTIEDHEREAIMPFVLRILFGRVQGSPRSNSQVGRKFAIVTILPNFSDTHIIDFIRLGANRIGYEKFFSGKQLPNLDRFLVRRLTGFINLLSEIYDTLGTKYAFALESTIEPLIYSLVVTQHYIDTGINEVNERAAGLGKAIRNIRSNAMRCLGSLFKILDEEFDWEPYVVMIYENIVSPRIENFVSENLQQTSSLLKVITCWIEKKNTIQLLLTDNLAPASAAISLLSHEKTKEGVLLTVLDFARKVLKQKGVQTDEYFSLLALVVSTLLDNLPRIIDGITDRELGSITIDVLILLVEGNYIDDYQTKNSILQSLTSAIDKPRSQIELKDKVLILRVLSSLVDNFECSFDNIKPLYETVSKSFRVYPEKNVRQMLVSVLLSIGNRFSEVHAISLLIADLNAFSTTRLQELDFEKRLEAFRKINEEEFCSFDPNSWLPILYCCLFFINDQNEMAIRSNASYSLRRFIDCFSSKDEETSQNYIGMLKNIILPQLRLGLRKDNEDVQNEYIAVLEHLVCSSKHYNELDDMRILTFSDDDESNFFKNVNHIQLHRRQRAIRRLIDYRSELSSNSIAHYILPIVERYALSSEEKFKNIGHEAFETISILVRSISWNQYKALFRRYISNLKSNKEDLLRNHVHLIISISKSLMLSHLESQESEISDRGHPSDQEAIDAYILQEVFPPISKVLVVRNDETIVARAPLAEALSYLVTCITEERIASELPGILTSTCQVMRSRSEELRDAVRKSLGNIVKLLGPKYLRFVLKELKGALSRGSQIHVLSFTTHYLLASISDSLSHGDLDDTLDIVVDIVMEDIFGAAGQEKDAEGYNSKMKEVKHKKCFDVAELLSANINLKSFGTLLAPIKLLLQEGISLKTQNKLDELLRRYALGLNHNDESSNREMLFLCHEIHSESENSPNQKEGKFLTQSEKHFIVNLNAKKTRAQVNSTIYVQTFQRFSLELLRTAISRHDNHLTVPNMVAFIPLLEQDLKSESEGVVISCLRILNTVVRLPFNNQEEAIFTASTRKALAIIKENPSTNAEICQAALRFLATTIRHKPDIKIKESAIAYTLERILPDLQEPNKQGLAFNFLKAVVSQHIMIPELYDVMDKVSKIMIVNHSKDIRDMSRSVYFMFLMEYDQGRGRLERQFKFLVDNLSFPTETGRQSVMELIHSIVTKAGLELLDKLATSFFVALANVLVSDEEPKCREMASSLIGNIIRKLGAGNVDNIEKYCLAWSKQSQNQLLKRCGLNIYKIYVAEFGVESNQVLKQTALDSIKFAIEAGNSSDGAVEWELLYSALSLFSTLTSKLRESILDEEYESIWNSIIRVLLFPHSWVRLISSRIIEILLSGLDTVKFEIDNYKIQTIAYRQLHQLAAPQVSEDLGNQIVKNLVLISMKWEKENTKYEHVQTNNTADQKYDYANDYLVARICSILRSDINSNVSFESRKSAIKLSAMLLQITGEDRLSSVSESLLLGLFQYTELEPKNGNEESLVTLSLECLQLIENKLGVTQYTTIFTKVKQKVNSRRVERKTKRAQLAVNAPDVAARRKLRKHERTREKRKHEKDENGFYHSKRRK